MSRKRASQIQEAGGEPLISNAVTRQLRQTNLDLLPILYEVLRTRSLSKAARVLNITQPSVSKALRQLRETFEDELIISPGRNGRLTEKASSLLTPLSQSLASLDNLLRPEHEFDPSVDEATFVIAAIDYVCALLAPKLINHCAVHAPNVSFEFVEPTIRNPEELRRVDFLIAPLGYEEMIGKQIGQVNLWVDDYVCIASKTHGPKTKKITPEQFQRSRHLSLLLRAGARAPISLQILPTAKFETQSICSAPSFSALASIVEETDCLALIPRKLAKIMCKTRDLKSIELDHDDKAVSVDLFWAQAATTKRGHKWAKELIIEIVQSFA